MSTPYAGLVFPDPPEDRPYIAINMVTTIDGKILSGERDESVMDLGTQLDHETMRTIEAACDAVMIGAGTLRSTKGLWYPERLLRFVVTNSGNVPLDSRFFTDVPAKAWVLTKAAGAQGLPAEVQRMSLSGSWVWHTILSWMRKELGVKHLLVEGGSELNASLLKEDLADELFCTVAPKVRLGRDVPTYADGEPLPRSGILRFDLVSCTPFGNEVYLRYRRSP